jgi:cholesterol transport system auxiliary component
VLLAISALGGCASNILESKIATPHIYVLRNNDAGTAKVAYPMQLRITLPSASPGLNTERIAVLRNGNQLDYYYGARWGSTAPRMVQSFLINLLQSQQGYKNVVTDVSQVGADYILEIDLQHFQAEYANDSDAPRVHVALTATVFEVKSRKSLATLQAVANETAKDNRLGAVVIAFQSATHAASVSLSEQLESTLGKALLK